MWRVSIIICSKNKGDSLDLCLKSVIGQKFRGNLEIIVVDAMSTDNTPQILQKYAKHVKVVHDHGKDLTAARNIGLKHSTGDIIIHWDADYILHPDAIQSSIKYFEQDIDALILNEGITTGMGFWREVRSWELSISSRSYGRLGEPSSAPKDLYSLFKGELGTRAGYTRFFRRDVLENVGGHAVEISFYGEDAELYWRLLRNGAKIRYASDVIFYRIEENTLAEICRKAYRYGTKMFDLYKYNKKYLINCVGPYVMAIFPVVPVFLLMMGLRYSRSVKNSIGLFSCSWLRMVAQSLGITQSLFGRFFYNLRMKAKLTEHSRENPTHKEQ